MNQIERLLIVDACRDLIHRYAYLNDAREFPALAELFTEDAVLYRPSRPDHGIVGRAAILQALSERPSDAQTFHLCTDVIIEVESSQLARARSRILLLAGTRAAAGALPEPGSLKPLLPGTFRDELVLTTSGWKFSRRTGRVWLAE